MGVAVSSVAIALIGAALALVPRVVAASRTTYPCSVDCTPYDSIGLGLGAVAATGLGTALVWGLLSARTKLVLSTDEPNPAPSGATPPASVSLFPNGLAGSF
jgi:hypothetical protein